MDDAAAMSRVPRSINGTVNTMYFLPKKGVKNCGGTSPNGIGLLGKDERRSLVRGRGSKEGKDTSKYRQQQNPPVPSTIKSNSAMNVKRRPDRSNKSKLQSRDQNSLAKEDEKHNPKMRT
ncbi:hypothetical protein SEVIR_7G164801v4 [Setaria viridis]